MGNILLCVLSFFYICFAISLAALERCRAAPESERFSLHTDGRVFVVHTDEDGGTLHRRYYHTNNHVRSSAFPQTAAVKTAEVRVAEGQG